MVRFQNFSKPLDERYHIIMKRQCSTLYIFIIYYDVVFIKKNRIMYYFYFYIINRSNQIICEYSKTFEYPYI